MDYKKIYAIKKANEERILKVCPNCPNTSGIYFLLREENGFKFGYIGKAKHLLDRLGSHLSGRKQRIDRSLLAHGLWSEENQTGYRVNFLEYPEEKLNEMEQFYIKKYANAGYQLRNVESGGSEGKTDIGERKPSRGYYDGKMEGEKHLARELKHIIDTHLVISLKKDTKTSQKALEKFYFLLDK